MLEGLFLAVAEAVFSYLIDKLELVEQIKKWLKRDPATLAFQKALTRAYAAFARQYPEYTTSLFDQTFLAGPGAPELAKLLTRHLHPDPALFAQTWAISIGLDIHSSFCKEATKPAADFLKWLEMELKSEAVFQPIFDSRAMESLSELEGHVENLTKELKRGLHDALKAANDYEKIVTEVQGNIKDSNIVVGDKNQISVEKVYNYYYSGGFATLSDYYISPDAVFQRVRVDDFVGRGWLTAKVDNFLNDPNQKSGMFLLIGEAGVGKTSFMAHLVKESKYLHLFAEQVPGDANLQRALQSLGSQLVTRYQIAPYKDRDTLTQLAAFPDFLDKLLRLAANTLAQGEKIVIVCDALDEAGTAPNGYVFGLPSVLPENVYFILTQRPVKTKLPNVNTHTEKLEAQGQDNLHDMEAYLTAIAKRPEIAGQLRSKNHTEAFFVKTMKEKSLGVWMYLHYILEEISKGSRAPLDVESLPTGLVGYYAEYWSDWQDGGKGRGDGPQEWDALYAPLLATLAAAQEPIRIEQLIKWAKVENNNYQIRRLLEESWRAFLTIRDTDHGRIYAPYHNSFRDFLTGKVDHNLLRPTESYIVNDLAERTKEIHHRIVNIFQEQCNSNWHELLEQDYPRLHLTFHMAEANQHETLVKLLTEGKENISWAEARYKKEETYAGFLNDLEHVWRYAEQKKDLALCARCMLIENSIHTLATNIPPELLVELAKCGMWSYPRCLTTISHMYDDGRQAAAFNTIAEHIPITLQTEAVHIAENIKDDYARAASFISLMPYLRDETKLQVLEKTYASINKIKDLYSRIHEFIKFALHLDQDLQQAALQSVVNVLPEIDAHRRIRLIIDMIPLVNEDIKSQLRQKALDSLEEIVGHGIEIQVILDLVSDFSDDFHIEVLKVINELKSERGRGDGYRARVLTNLIPHLQDETKLNVTEQALAAAKDIADEYFRATALTSLIPTLNGDLKLKISEDVLAIAQSIANEQPQHYFMDDYLEGILSQLTPYLNDDLRSGVLTIVEKISNEYARTNLFVQIAPHLGSELKYLVLDYLEKIEKEERRIRALTDILPHLSQDLKSRVLQNILSTIQTSENSYLHVSTLINLLPLVNNDLSTKLQRETLVVLKVINDEEFQARALIELMPYSRDNLRGEILEEVLVVLKAMNLKGINDEEFQRRVITELIPYMSGNLRRQILQEILNTSQRIGDVE